MSNITAADVSNLLDEVLSVPRVVSSTLKPKLDNLTATSMIQTFNNWPEVFKRVVVYLSKIHSQVITEDKNKQLEYYKALFALNMSLLVLYSEPSLLTDKKLTAYIRLILGNRLDITSNVHWDKVKEYMDRGYVLGMKIYRAFTEKTELQEKKSFLNYIHNASYLKNAQNPQMDRALISELLKARSETLKLFKELWGIMEKSPDIKKEIDTEIAKGSYVDCEVLRSLFGGVDSRIKAATELETAIANQNLDSTAERLAVRGTISVEDIVNAGKENWDQKLRKMEVKDTINITGITAPTEEAVVALVDQAAQTCSLNEPDVKTELRLTLLRSYVLSALVFSNQALGKILFQ